MYEYERLLQILQEELRALEKPRPSCLKIQHPKHHPPRIRHFVLASGKGQAVVWGFTIQQGKIGCVYPGGETYYLSMSTVGHAILQLTGCQPRLVLRAIRRIQAATAWCKTRTESRKRAAQEILRQQQGALSALEAEAAMQALCQ